MRKVVAAVLLLLVVVLRGGLKMGLDASKIIVGSGCGG
jgi:hypothetical protein